MTQTKIEYYGISLPRLFFSSFFSLGLYELYWFYRQWLAVKKAQKSDIRPILRSVLSPLFIFPLMFSVLRQARRGGAKVFPGEALLLSVIYLLSGIITSLRDLECTAWGEFVGIIVLYVIAILPLLPLQAAVNFNNRQQFPNWRPAVHYNDAEKRFMKIGGLLFVLACFGLAGCLYRMLLIW